MTQERIKDWIDYFGEDHVCISFSGGKDSTVLMDIARKLYPDMKGVFVDTGLEFPELREFVKLYENVEWVKPRYTFKQVIKKYGYPFISKQISECIYYSQRYLRRAAQEEDPGKNPKCFTTDEEWREFLTDAPWRIKAMFGVLDKNMKFMPRNAPDKSNRSKFNYDKYRFTLEPGAPPISSLCCDVMKKAPLHKFQTKNDYYPMTAQMACESRLRVSQWLLHGCNAYDLKSPISNPMAFWTEQDVLLYIYLNDLPICSVYGTVMADYPNGDPPENKSDLLSYNTDDARLPVLTLSGCQRTGCIFCGFGVHLSSSPNRFEQLAQTHPQLYDYVMRGGEFDENGIWGPDSTGLGYWYCLEWINKHGNYEIAYPNRDYYLDHYMTAQTAKYLPDPD